MPRFLVMLLLLGAMMAPVHSTAKENKAGYGITDSSPNVIQSIDQVFTLELMPAIVYNEESKVIPAEKTSPYRCVPGSEGRAQSRSLMKLKINRLRNSK